MAETVRTPRFVVTDPPHMRGQSLVLPGTSVVLGRNRHRDFPLDDAYVSRTHAVVRRRGDGAVIEDLGSTGGTRVNGRLISGATDLRTGDLLDLGRVHLRYDGCQDDQTATLVAPTPQLPAGQPPKDLHPFVDVRYEIDQQHGGVISNVGRDQYNAYVGQRASFMRDVAATKSRRASAHGSAYCCSSAVMQPTAP
jgi:hypothetical protein